MIVHDLVKQSSFLCFVRVPIFNENLLSEDGRVHTFRVKLEPHVCYKPLCCVYGLFSLS